MLKKIFSLLMVTLLWVAMVQPAVAHDGWSQTHSPIVEPGENVYVELLFGNHSNDHASYRIEGTWNEDDTDVMVTTPDGERVDISDTIFYMGETAAGEVNEEMLGVNNYHIASFSSSSPGVYIVSAERDSIFESGDQTSRTLSSAKSFVAVSEIPLVSYVEDLEGYDAQVAVDRAEFVPQFNPAAVTPDEEVSVQLLEEGEPLAEEDVSLIRRSTSDAETLTTDEGGMVTFTTGPADYYLMRAMPDAEESEAGEYDSMSYEATMTFTVQNGEGLSMDELAQTVDTESTETQEMSDTVTDTEDTSGQLFTNPFFYVTVVLGLGLIGSLLVLFRK